MKKAILGGVAFATLGFIAPAFAEEKGLELGLAGQFRGYGVYVSQDDALAPERHVDMVRESEVHFTGKTKLDNGLTVGVHIEAETDRGDGFALNETYAYFSGDWGKVNIGSEDSTTFLMQVAAPAADTNVDGVRQYVYPFNYSVATAVNAEQDYDHNVTGKADKFTYISPMFDGLQVGVSYTPEITGTSRSFGVSTDNNPGDYGDAIEGAVRFEHDIGDGVKAVIGGGYTHASLEAPSGASVDDRQAWNVGLNLKFGDIAVGGAYTVDDKGTASDDETDIVVGASYDVNDDLTVGASYYNQDDEVGTDVKTDRYTVGATYGFGPGMSFRGSLMHVKHDIAGTGNLDGTAAIFGTEIKF